MDQRPHEKKHQRAFSTSQTRQTSIDTACMLRNTDRRWVRQRMTVVVAQIVEELRGVSCLPLERCPQGRKSVTCSQSFGMLVESMGDLREAVAAYMTKAAERLRRSGLAAGVVTVFINTSRFSADPQYSNSATHPAGRCGTKFLRRSRCYTTRLEEVLRSA